MANKSQINSRKQKFPISNGVKFIPVHEPLLNGKEAEYVNDCLRTNWISSQGEYVKKFEKSFADYCGVKYGVANPNGTTALHLALLALQIKQGDEVIVPDLTFISPVNIVIYTGARPILVDVEKDTWNIDPDKIEKAITPKTKAIIAVHLYGHPCRMDRILKIAKKHNLFVIEDCAEAHGAEYKNKRVGGFGHISCFSFFGNKVITTGEGGMSLTNNKKLASRMRALSNYGMTDLKKKFWHGTLGLNYRLTNVQAAIGLGQLEQIDKLLGKRREVTESYDRYFKNIDGLVLSPKQQWAKPVCWLYSILISSPQKRNKLIKGLKEKNIETRPLFYPVHKMPPYKKYIKKNQTFPVAEDLSARGLSLPSSPKLTLKQVSYIAQTIKKLCSN